MIKEALKSFPMIWLTCVGLLIFFAVFLGVLSWVLRKGSKSIYQKTENIPFEEEVLP